MFAKLHTCVIVSVCCHVCVCVCVCDCVHVYVHVMCVCGRQWACVYICISVLLRYVRCLLRLGVLFISCILLDSCMFCLYLDILVLGSQCNQMVVL